MPTHSLILVFLALAALSPSLPAADKADYLRDVKPLLTARCISCHGALRQKGDLRLDAAQLLRQGGDRGPTVVAGKSTASLLIDAVTGGNGMPRMPPPTEGPQLTEAQIVLLRAWIDQGAVAPVEAVPEDPRTHWAFRPPVRPALPATAPIGWVRNPIDAFVAAEQARHGVRPTPPAAPETLLRRVYLDLIGLPPTRAQLLAFREDTSPEAYEKVVDALLASPQYGERWARHWMDVWRYSDWYGRRGVPDVWNSAPQVWRWRDWMIRSLNADKGYDRMVAEMLAGDEIAPEDPDTVVATGYLARNWYALNPNQWMRDLVEHTGKAFLGLTFNCAHCHDHKYDPILQVEYFRFRAFFEPLEMRQDRWPGEPDPGPYQVYNYSTLRKIVPHGAVQVFDGHPERPTHMYHLGDERQRMEGKPPVTAAAPAFLGGDRLRIEPVTLPPRAWYPGLNPVFQQEDVARAEQAVSDARAALPSFEHHLESARQLLAEAQAQSNPNRPVPPTVADVRNGLPARIRALETALTQAKARLAAAEAALHSLPANQAEAAQRLAAYTAAEERCQKAERALAAAREQGANTAEAEKLLQNARLAADRARKALAEKSPSYTPLGPLYPPSSTGRRTALARWLTGRSNPLPARVAVNHIWMRHLDRPLVDSVFDFGRNGKRPSHPELLDWLAVEFMESGWSMKRIHRLIVTSNTYRQQSAAAEPDHPGPGRDGDNRWYWRFPGRRMEAEVVRDSVLYLAGELDPRIGGPVLEISAEATSNRRSLYFAVHPEGGGHLKFLELFDAPDPCDCYRRTNSIVPQQALGLTNSRLLLEQSRLLARKLPAGEAAPFVVAAFEQVLCRPPSAAEQQVCLEFLHRQEELFRSAPALPTTGGDSRVPPSADPVLRARESLVRSLFNHGDFVTVR